MVKTISNKQINTISGGECSECICVFDKENEFANYLQGDQSSLGMTARLVAAYTMADGPDEISIDSAASPKDCNNKCSRSGYISGYCK